MRDSEPDSLGFSSAFLSIRRDETSQLRLTDPVLHYGNDRTTSVLCRRVKRESSIRAFALGLDRPSKSVAKFPVGRFIECARKSSDYKKRPKARRSQEVRRKTARRERNSARDGGPESTAWLGHARNSRRFSRPRCAGENFSQRPAGGAAETGVEHSLAERHPTPREYCINADHSARIILEGCR
jgi:hypothetical protein